MTFLFSACKLLVRTLYTCRCRFLSAGMSMEVECGIVSYASFALFATVFCFIAFVSVLRTACGCPASAEWHGKSAVTATIQPRQNTSWAKQCRVKSVAEVVWNPWGTHPNGLQFSAVQDFPFCCWRCHLHRSLFFMEEVHFFAHCAALSENMLQLRIADFSNPFALQNLELDLLNSPYSFWAVHAGAISGSDSGCECCDPVPWLGSWS